MTLSKILRKSGYLLAYLVNAASCFPSTSAAAAQGNDLLRPFTVKDSIERSTIDGLGENALTRSPDGRQFAFATSKGDLSTGMVRSTVWIVSQDKQGGFGALASVERISSTNEAPISSLRWVDSGRALAFLSPDNHGYRQVFRYDIRSRKSVQVTHLKADVNTFDVKGDVCVFFATAKGSPLYPAPGGYLKDESLIKLILPEDDNLGKTSAAYIQHGQREARRITEPAVNLLRTWVQFAIAPVGDKAVAILPASPPDPSFVAAWNSTAGAPKLINNIPNMALQLNLIDLASGTVAPLLSAPTASAMGNYAANHLLWSHDGSTVIVTNTLLGPKDLPASQSLPTGPQTVEIEPRRAKTVRVLPTEDAQPGERIGELSWKSPNELLAISAAGAGGAEGLANVVAKGQRWLSTFHRIGQQWARATRAEIPLTSRLTIGNVEFFVEEDANTPPRVVGQELGTAARKFVFDPNPQLQQLKLLPIRAISWTDKEGHNWSGGLIMPTGASPNGDRLPLVIELKFFDPSRFLPDGPYTTAFASQALAAKGIAVLELNAFDAPTMGTSLEGPMQMRGIESAIDFLVAQHHVDTDRVGLIGFSRTCYHVSYALTHSSRRFAAATIADGLSGGYIQYHAYSLNHSPGNGVKPLYDAFNSGPPWGENLQNWIKNSPDMNAGKISAPLRIEMLGRSSVLQEWEIYSSLKLQNKPVDVLYLPGATHVLVKPRERYLSQQGNVNWFSFWLKGDATEDGENEKDFKRWKALKNG